MHYAYTQLNRNCMDPKTHGFISVAHTNTAQNQFIFSRDSFSV